MATIATVIEALRRSAKVRDNFIQAVVEFERASDHPHSNVRETVSGPLCDELFTGERFSKTLDNGLKMHFVYNSKIAREFLLSQPATPNHVWEPQTTKLLLHFSRRAGNAIIAGAYFGDHAIPLAHALSKTGGHCHAFEPNQTNADLILENARLNGLSNIRVNHLALWNKSNEHLVFEGEDALASTVPASASTGNALLTITIDDYVAQAGVGAVGLLMIDVEGSELKVLQGAARLLREHRPVVIFETHSLYDDWSRGLGNAGSCTLMAELGYTVFAVREFHQNIDTGNMPVELLPLDRTYCEIPPHHGFNLLAVPSANLIADDLFRIVHDLSPKLILTKQDVRFLPSQL